MKPSLRFSLLIAVTICLVTAASVFSQTSSQSTSLTDSQKAFNTVKTLPGMWEGKDQTGGSVKVSFKVTSGGSAIMSEILGDGPEDMISMFSMDGPGRLVMTHYCSAGNQPRMLAAVSPDGKTITFTYFDATNLAAPDAGHMQRMVLTLVDDNHHVEEWTFNDHGKEMKKVFDLRRQM